MEASTSRNPMGLPGLFTSFTFLFVPTVWKFDLFLT
jgi:hypothetical protein